MRQRKVTEELFYEVKAMSKKGFSTRDIAEKIGFISFHTVAQIINSNSLQAYFVRPENHRERMKKSMARGTAITEDTFDNIKSFLNKGKKGVTIAELFDLNPTTISTINTSKDFEEYKERTQTGKTMCDDWKQSQNTMISPSALLYNFNRLYSEMQKQTELLERLVKQWQS